MTCFGPTKPGRDAGIRYAFNTATSGDPGSGKLLFNNATLASATSLHISETDGDGNALSALLATWDDSTSTVRGKLQLRKVNDPDVFAEFSISGTITDSGTYDAFTVAHVASNGSLSSDDELRVLFLRTGDKGDTGAAGSNGSNGTNGTDGRDAGWNYKFSTSTSGDPGAGKVLFNNATLGSATQVNVSKTDDDTNNLSSVVGTWDDGTGAVVGYITVKKVGTPTTFAVFAVTGLATGGFDHIACAGVMLQSAGTFSNNDEVMVSYVPSGIPKVLHYAQAARAAAQSIPHNSITAVSWDTTILNNGMTVGSSGITLARAGTYRVEWSAGMPLNDGNLLLMRPLKNSAAFGPDARFNVGAGGTSVVIGSFVFSGAASDVITASIFQDSGGSVNTPTATATRPYLTVTEL